MDRNFLKGRNGDRINAVAAGCYNFSLLLHWLAAILLALILALVATGPEPRSR